MKATVDATDEDFDQIVLGATVVVLIEFWAPWCGPCKAIEPKLQALATKHADRVMIVKVDIGQSPHIVHTYGIHSVPTFMFVDGNQIVWQKAGSISPKALEDLIFIHT